jgi:predicted RNA-binding protein YlxR (DUF448 family)
LVRIALDEQGARVDETGKGPGRGAYLCRRSACWIARERDARLAQALKSKLTDTDKSRLTEWARAHEAEWSSTPPDTPDTATVGGDGREEG